MEPIQSVLFLFEKEGGLRTFPSLSTARKFTIRARKKLLKTRLGQFLPPIPTLKWKRVILKIQSALAKEGIENWVSHGTLLGLLRQGKPIAHDKDIDFGFLSQNSPDGLIRALREIGGWIEKVEGRPSGNLRIKLSVHGISVDLYEFVLSQDQTSATMQLMRGPNLDDAKTYLFEFPWSRVQRFQVKRNQVNVPNNPTLYLASHYGTDWRVGVKHWSIWDSPSNVHEIRALDIDLSDLETYWAKFFSIDPDSRRLGMKGRNPP